MSRIAQTSILTLSGALTSGMTAALLVFLRLRYGLTIYGFTLWLVIPLGAMLSGGVAASGYYIGSRFLNIRPTRDLRIGIVLVSAATFFFLYWLQYMVLTVQGKPIHDLVSYDQYLGYLLGHASMQFDFNFNEIGGPVDIGLFGYFFAALQIVGTAFGGLVMYSSLSDLLYCEECKRYVKKKGSQERYFEGSDDFGKSVALVQAGIQANHLQQSVRTHAQSGSRRKEKYSDFASVIDISACKKCAKHWLQFRVKHRDERGWNAMPQLQFSICSAQHIELATDTGPSSKLS